MIGVILAGGSGTRLWPQSRGCWPKFLLKFSKHSLLQESILRLASFIPPEKILIITNAEHRFLVQEDAADLKIKLPNENIICEPSPKNTAPAIAVVSRYAFEKLGDEPMIICPSDHLIKDTAKFSKIVNSALPSAQKGYIVVFGISPTRPETGYGYIKFSDKVSQDIYGIEKFVEKPDFRAARDYLRRKNYFWNAGIFLFKPSVMLGELKRYLPELYTAVNSWSCAPAGLKSVFKKIEPESIDYGVLEKTKKIAACKLDVAWDDLGDWNSMSRVYASDNAGNIINGRVVDIGSANTTVIAGPRLIATVGLKNTIVVDTEDALLVCDKTRSQEVKTVVGKISKTGQTEELLYHKKVSRPWGDYTVLEKGKGYKVKIIHVLPGKKLSLQKHKRRSEHWLVVDGTAKIVKDKKFLILKKGQMVEIPSFTTHRLENISKKLLKIIEISRGKYIGEDDIIRIQDDFNRK